jgi:hypothetical protein
MSTLFWGQNRDAIPADENVVRRTTDPVRTDAPAAEMEGRPEYNETETDANPDLGMVNRQVASDWNATTKYSPSWAGTANPTESFAYVNSRIDSVGTAAEREMRGEQGHGTMAFAVGVEPVIREGGQFGADYFAVDPRLIQEAAGDYMIPDASQDHDSVSATAGQAVRNAKDAGAAGQYAAWYGALMNGMG